MSMPRNNPDPMQIRRLAIPLLLALTTSACGGGGGGNAAAPADTFTAGQPSASGRIAETGNPATFSIVDPQAATVTRTP